MTDWPKVAVLLITYARTHEAIRTILGVKQRLHYPGALQWIIADDGSDREHLHALYQAIGEEVPTWYGQRQGVGVSMNHGQVMAWKAADYILWLEDDWELEQPFDLSPCIQLLQEQADLGMVRLGYISPGVWGQLISGAGRLWWKLSKGPTYTFTGHASLRARRFFDAYGPYAEDLAPGETELYMCGTFNNRPGPDVVIPAFTGEWGPFAHIGGRSLKDIRPGVLV